MIRKVYDWVEEVPGDTDHSGRPYVPMRETALWQALNEAGLFSGRHTRGTGSLLDFDLLGHHIEHKTIAMDWCRFSIEQRHPVLIRRGLGGLYQIDLTRYIDAIRESRRESS